MHIWTETPIHAIWDQLRYLQSPANVRNLLIGSVPSARAPWPATVGIADKADEIAACIRQADEYYRSAEIVGPATEPLLQFYGMESLAKAAILASRSELSLLDLKYHGLSTRASNAKLNNRSLQDYADDPLSWNLESEFAVVNEGVFSFLCEVFNDAVVPKSEVIRLKELLRILPDLATFYSRHYNEHSYCAYLYEEPKISKDGIFEIFFSSKEDLAELQSVFPQFASGFSLETKHTHFKGFKSLSAVETLPDFILIQNGTVAGRFLVRPHVTGLYKTPTATFALLFILSNIVRYKPAFWMSMLEGKVSGTSSLLTYFCSISKRRFTNDILELIWNEEFTYGTPAWLG